MDEINKVLHGSYSQLLDIAVKQKVVIDIQRRQLQVYENLSNELLEHKFYSQPKGGC